MASKSKIIAELFEADGDIVASALDNVVVTPTAVSDQANTSTGGFSMPAGTTAQRPGSPDAGESRYNSTTGSLEFYDGSSWIATNLIPSVDSVTGTIYVANASNLTITVSNSTDTVDVVYKEGATTVATVTGQTVSSGSITTAVPSAVYGQTSGDTMVISVLNADGTPSSNAVSKTVSAIPSGGTVTTSGGARIHTFNSSGTFATGGYAGNVEYLVLAAGAGGGIQHGGGGGAGGYRTNVSGQTSGGGGSAESTYSITASQNITVTVGAGGAGVTTLSSMGGLRGASGGNSVFGTITSLGGGGGTSMVTNNNSGNSGGSGGGGALDATGGGGTSAGGAGTSGQGYAGGTNTGYSNSNYGGGGGGGGAGAAGENAPANGSAYNAGDGGVGVSSNITGSNVTRGGGGGGGSHNPFSPGAGGSSLGGAGGQGNNQNGFNAPNANTGSGGGGSGANNHIGGNGNSGVVIVRYTL